MLKAENAAGSIEQIFSAGDISRTKHKAWYGKKKRRNRQAAYSFRMKGRKAHEVFAKGDCY
jgi:hypothetical protein